MDNFDHASLFNFVLEPILSLLDTSAAVHFTRKCDSVSDKQFVSDGVLRVLNGSVSGREFVQAVSQNHQSTTKRSNYFEQLSSRRRHSMLEALFAEFEKQNLSKLRSCTDSLALIPELNGREIWAGDGHTIAHATHDPREVSYREKDHCKVMRSVPVHSIYALDLRTGWSRHLALSSGKDHEVKTLKYEEAKALRVEHKKGAIWVYDRAAVDIGWWQKLKRQYGIYIISRTKANMRPMHELPNQWDRNDDRNLGVMADETLGFNNNGQLRRVKYRDPETHAYYEFLTSEMELPPGIIAILYRKRWDIEKGFDEFENKFSQKKAWATSATAKTVQSIFITIARNLLLLHQAHLAVTENITDEKLTQRRAEEHKSRDALAADQGRELCPLWFKVRRVTQFSSQFIRWLRHHLAKHSSYSESLTDLRPLMDAYI